MVGRIFDDVRRILLGLLFLIAFGWMAAQAVPGQVASHPAPQVAQVAQLDLNRPVVPPRP